MPHADPHRSQPVLASPGHERASVLVLMLHGRGATADSMMALAAAIGRPDAGYLAPQAAGSTWYPERFTAPIARNEPWLSSALSRVGALVDDAVARGVAHERIVLLGFSQGACLALEYAARHARRYGGIVGLSGGLIGPDGTPRDYAGRFAGTPVFLGCDAEDFHIPLQRVHETASVFSAMGASVTTRIYHGMGHTVSEEELEQVGGLIGQV